MKNYTVLKTFIVVLLCIWICECQITFSRGWIRSKLPGEKKLDDGDYDVRGIPAFLRQAKSPIDSRHNLIFYPQDSKVLRNLRTKLRQDLFFKWRYPTATRLKAFDILNEPSE